MFLEDDFGFTHDIDDADDDHYGTSIGDLTDYYAGGGQLDEWYDEYMVNYEAFLNEANSASVSDLINAIISLQTSKSVSESFSNFNSNFNLGDLLGGTIVLTDTQLHTNITEHHISSFPPNSNGEYTVNLGSGRVIVLSGVNSYGYYDYIRATSFGNSTWISYTNADYSSSGNSNFPAGTLDDLDADALNDLIGSVLSEDEDGNSVNEEVWYHVPADAELAIVVVVNNLHNELYNSYVGDYSYTNFYEKIEKTLLLNEMAKLYTNGNHIESFYVRNSLGAILKKITLPYSTNSGTRESIKSFIMSDLSSTLDPELDINDDESLFIEQIDRMVTFIRNEGKTVSAAFYKHFFSDLNNNNLAQFIDAYKSLRNQYLPLRAYELTLEYSYGAIRPLILHHDIFNNLDNMELELAVSILSEIPEDALEEEDIEKIEELRNQLNGSTTLWYYDNDGDGYHSETEESDETPSGKWSLSSNGLDCDDDDADVTVNCDGDEEAFGFVGGDGERVVIAINKGTLEYSDNTPNDLRFLIDLANETCSNTLKAQILETSNSLSKIEIEITDEFSSCCYGVHQAYDSEGNLLEWNSEINDFDGVPAYVGDTPYYERAKITIHRQNITLSNRYDIGFGNAQWGNTREGQPRVQLTLLEAMLATFSHESHHNVDLEFIQLLRNKRNGGDISNKAIKEAVHKNVHPREYRVWNELGECNGLN